MKPKLLPLDCFLPFFIQGKVEGLFHSAEIFVFDKKFRQDYIENSKLYSDLIKKYNIKITSYKTNDKYFDFTYLVSVFYLYLRLFFVLLSISKHRKVVFGLRDLGGLGNIIIPKIIKLFNILNCYLFLTPHTQSLVKKVNKNNGKKINLIKFSGEKLILSSLKNIGGIPSEKKDQLRYVGYPRGYDKWWQEIEHYCSLNYSNDKFEQPIFWPLNVLYRRNGNLDIHVGEGILDLLSKIAKMKYQPPIIFKLHPTTNKQEFELILKESKYLNYKISNEPACVLIEKSKLVISTLGTTVFVDANYRKKPCMLYSSPETLKGNTNGHFSEDVFSDFAQFMVLDDPIKAYEIFCLPPKEIIKRLEKDFVDFSKEIIKKNKLISLLNI